MSEDLSSSRQRGPTLPPHLLPPSSPPPALAPQPLPSPLEQKGLSWTVNWYSISCHPPTLRLTQKGNMRAAGPLQLHASRHLPASPTSGVEGGSSRLTRNHHVPLASPSFSNTALSWARVVREGARASATLPSSRGVTRYDFLSLYEKNIVAGYHAHVDLQDHARKHEISVLCCLP
jgi:hypothetical protein